MKPVILLWVCFAGVLVRAGAQEMVRPIVAPKFGQPVVITGEFVDKPNDYYSQNMVPEPYSLRVEWH